MLADALELVIQGVGRSARMVDYTVLDRLSRIGSSSSFACLASHKGSKKLAGSI